jgi:hypothetical protein
MNENLKNNNTTEPILDKPGKYKSAMQNIIYIGKVLGVVGIIGIGVASHVWMVESSKEHHKILDLRTYAKTIIAREEAPIYHRLDLADMQSLELEKVKSGVEGIATSWYTQEFEKLGWNFTPGGGYFFAPTKEVYDNTVLKARKIDSTYNVMTRTIDSIVGNNR